jgi:hypothetical protein
MRELDCEWVELIVQAKKIGLKCEDVLAFLAESKKEIKSNLE